MISTAQFKGVSHSALGPLPK